MQELHDLDLLLRSHTPILIIESQEEPRIVQLFTRLAFRLGGPAYRWTVTDGLRRLEADFDPLNETTEPAQVLKYIKGLSRGGLFLLLDFHPFLSEPVNIRLIKEIAQTHEDNPRTLILVSHALDIPPELRHLTARFELHLPDRAALATLIKEQAKAWEVQNRRTVKASRKAVRQLANNLLGMTASDARRLIRDAIHKNGAITRDDLPEVMKAKFQLMSGEVMNPCVLWMDEIFFVDLPDAETRKTIFSIHLRRRNLAPSGFDLERLATASDGFTGAGIEQVVVSALYAARAQDQTLDDRHLLEELERTQPLSVVMAERIRYLRDWAQERTVPAG